jgi:type 1 glutamine amidotransferase
VSRVLVVSGAGEYSDPWHPFGETSERLGAILQSRHEVTVTTDVAAALAGLDADAWEVAVLNFGSAERELPTDAACVDGISRFAAAGGALLACHVVATVFPADPRWEDILGGRWVRGTTMHPPQGDAEIRISPTAHAVTRGLHDFVLVDERYSYLRVSPLVQVLATHIHDELEHPVIWAHRLHSSRVVYDGLGHDARSYDSEDHCRLVLNAVGWLLGDDA